MFSPASAAVFRRLWRIGPAFVGGLRTWPSVENRHSATIGRMADQTPVPLEQQLDEIGAQLAWVRDYL